jgi:hypothetical protein
VQFAALVQRMHGRRPQPRPRVCLYLT